MSIAAKVICHSVPKGAPKYQELITVEVEFHRFILPEINTHRVLSRNYQSSRAVPVEKLLSQVRNDPAIPVHWGKNQRGMVAEEELSGDILNYALRDWKQAAIYAAAQADMLQKKGVHKQIANRLLEPFMWTKGVITGTRSAWDSVFALRCHPDAQPEFQALAYKIRGAIEASTPRELGVGEWHLPYYEGNYGSGYWKPSGYAVVVDETLEPVDAKVRGKTLHEAIKISTSCCAQVSYRNLDDSLEKALKIYDMLNLPENGVFKEDMAHCSPCEHQACVLGSGDYFFQSDKDQSEGGFSLNGNFGSTLHKTKWAQHRKILEQGLEGVFIPKNSITSDTPAA